MHVRRSEVNANKLSCGVWTISVIRRTRTLRLCVYLQAKRERYCKQTCKIVSTRAHPPFKAAIVTAGNVRILAISCIAIRKNNPWDSLSSEEIKLWRSNPLEKNLPSPVVIIAFTSLFLNTENKYDNCIQVSPPNKCPTYFSMSSNAALKSLTNSGTTRFSPCCIRTNAVFPWNSTLTRRGFPPSIGVEKNRLIDFG